MASKSLGPFPKTHRWWEVVHDALPPSRRCEACELADCIAEEILAAYAALEKDPVAIRVVTYLVTLVVATRHPDPLSALNEDLRIEARFDGESLIEEAARATVKRINDEAQTTDPLFDTDPWRVWRAFDGAAFCDLARTFFTELNRVYVAEALRRHNLNAPEETIPRFAHEMSLITRSFSARWFNACARFQTPEQGSIAWYLGHCLGKLDLEFSRELSTWKEPEGNPWKRRKAESGQIALAFD